MEFLLNIKGQLNNIHLAEAKALWPLFEAVVNSIQAIEDSENKTCGKIEIYAHREETSEIRFDEDPKKKEETLEKFLSQSQITELDLTLKIMSLFKLRIQPINLQKDARESEDFSG